MKIAIASEGRDINSTISSRGGRAPFYLIFEGKKFIESLANPFAQGGRNAGLEVADVLANKGVDMVIMGNIGPKMAYAFKSKNIKVEIKMGRIKDVL